jgi:Flp pilus assembly protein TadG
MMKRIRSRVGSSRGAELIEFALVLPLLLLVVLGIVDFGFVFQRLEVVTNAAREGARVGSLTSTYSATDVCNRVVNYMTAGGLTVTGSCPSPTNPVFSYDSSYSIPLGAGTNIQGVRVRVTYYSTYYFLGPIIGWFGGSLSSVPINGEAIMRSETPSS